MKNYFLLFCTTVLMVSGYAYSQQQTWGENYSSNKSFVENKGQFNGRDWNKFGDVKYAYSQNPFYVFFSEKGLTYRFDRIIKNKKHKEDHTVPKRINISELVFVKWLNANTDIQIVQEDVVDHHHTYAMKDDKGETYGIKAKGYKKITYKNVYDNIDFEYLIHEEGGIKYNVLLHPGANPDDIQLEYSSNTTNTDKEFVNIGLNELRQLEINSSIGQIIEHEPTSYYLNKKAISSKYSLNGQVLSFELDNYDNTKEAIIDPWIVSPTFSTSTAVWEVETDGSGNVYTIGGETPMELWKYNSAGTLQWQYVTPWDTNNVWLGTLATDASGNSYVTSGVTAEMHKVDNGGNFVWQTALSGGLEWNSEWWSITFNCDETKLITGGTWVQGILSFDFYAGIFEIDVATGAVLSDQTVDQTNIGGFGVTPVEVRSISSSKNSKFIFLTHDDVGAINENFGTCPNEEPVFQVDNGHNLGYKCENYLPYTQNGGGLKALVANDNYIYTHSGDQVHRRDLTTGALINSAAIPGGASSTVPLIGGLVVENSGLDVDDCGNVYVGSGNQVIKYDAALNVLSSAATSFTVYDVSVNSNGEVVACGAQLDNDASNTNRNGRIEAVNLTACAQYSLVCCDANFCDPGDFCVTDAPVLLTPSTGGGTWSGPGVDVSGNFDPAIAGPGTHIITYTLACGSNDVAITVNPCATIDICEETNGDLTASGGDNNYTWYVGTINTVNTPITNEQECIDCPTATPQYAPIFGFYTGCDQTDCSTQDTTWAQYATGVTTAPPSGYPIMIQDGGGTTTIINNQGELVPCTTNPCTGVTITMNIDSQTDVSCFGGTDGAATVSSSGGTAPYSYIWAPGALSGNAQTGLAAGTYNIAIQDNAGCTGSGTVTITEPTALVAAANTTPATCGASDGTASGSAIGGTGPYSYSYSPTGGNNQNATGLAAGTYTLTVTDANGCTADHVFDILTTNGPTISLDNSSDISCFGANDGTANVSATGGTPGYTYSWMPGSLTGASQTGLAPDTYTVTVTDASGCTDQVVVVINEPTQIVLSTSNIVDANCGANDGAATVDAVGGTGNYTYSWSPQGGTGPTATNIPGGAYTVTVTDDSGCSEVINLTVPTLGGPTLSIVSTTDVSCFEYTDGTAEISASGGSAPYTYSWAPFGGTNSTATGLSAGTYTATVTDAGGCVSTIDVTITEPTAVEATETITDEDCGMANGAISLSASGGTPGYTYLWSPGGETTSSITGLSFGTYDVTITDANGCTYVNNYTVNQIGGLNVDATPELTVIDAGQSVQLNVVGATDYTWMPPLGLSCSTCDHPIATPGFSTVYIVTGTDANGCFGSDTIEIIVNPAPNNCGTIYVPNMFSPNGNNNNDFLCAYGDCITEMQFLIYNRWGEVVFESSEALDISIGNYNAVCWDGTHRGKPLNSGTYVYRINAKLSNDEEVIQSGNITLVR